jgi:hypothetical protein
VFTAEQLAELATLLHAVYGSDVIASSCIQKLATVIQPIRNLTQTPVPMADVRDRLTELEAIFARAVEQLSPPHSGEPSWTAVREARVRFLRSYWEATREPDPTKPLVAMRNAASLALAGLSKEQSRHRTAPLAAVGLIDAALFDGWVAGIDGDGTGAHEAIRLSHNLTSPFFKIVAICWQAWTGMADANPERAIRAYEAAQPLRRIQRIMHQAGVPKGRKGGRKANLPS